MSQEFEFDNDNNFIDDDDFMSRPITPLSSSSFDIDNYKPFTFSNHPPVELQKLINLVNINIEVYNKNHKKFNAFLSDIKKQINIIKYHLNIIFDNIYKLIYQIVIVENNYDMDRYDKLEKIIKESCRQYAYNLKERLSLIWQYSAQLENIQRQTALLLKKTLFILKYGYFELALKDNHQTNTEISAFFVKELGTKAIDQLITGRLSQLQKSLTTNP